MNIPTADPIARTSDPATSWKAATSVKKKTINTAMRTILSALSMSPLTDEELHDNHAPFHKVSPSGLRTRRNELLKAGLIVSCGEGKTKSGRSCHKWQLTLRGEEVAEYIKNHAEKITLGEALYETGPF